MNTIQFFKEGMKNLKTVGTLTRSSKYLCKGAIKHVDFHQADTIIELGAGDGVITKHILKGMKSGADLLAFEVNDKFCNKMRRIDDERLHVIEDSAENMNDHLNRLGLEQVDYIISAIPFVALPDVLGEKIVGECYKVLKNGGFFIQIHYSLLAKSLYDSVFGNVDVNFVPLNVPPAFVLVSEKQ
ncbi:MAG: methyltransferase domain-containing protein [Bacteroidetes bacterium]|nr:methyltransferase domain-containing protein [Bacteroidota bacterium]